MTGWTTAKLRRRASRAVGELEGNVSEPLPARVYDRYFGTVMARYLGPAIGMSGAERWYRINDMELEIVVDALEERAAIVLFNDEKARAA